LKYGGDGKAYKRRENGYEKNEIRVEFYQFKAIKERKSSRPTKRTAAKIRHF
jgi:hypothetical protein